MTTTAKSILLTALLSLTACPLALGQDTQLDCPAEPTDMMMNMGDIVSCAITPVADTDIFRFDGTSGHTVMLTLTDRTGGGPAPVAEIYSPGGAPLDTLVNQDSGDRVIWELTESGTYTVLVRESGDNQTVSYNLALQSIFPPSAEAQDLLIDTEVAEAIDARGDSDIFLFEGVADWTILLTLTDRTGGSPAPVADVYDPDGVIVATLLEQDTGDEWMEDLTKTGTYTVLITEAGDNQTNSYSLALQRLFPNPDTATHLHYGSVEGESISPIADSDVYYFGGKLGAQIILTLADLTGGGPAPVAEVFDPDKELIATLVNQDGSDPWQTTLAKEGIYTVLVRESGYNQTVSYNLGLQCLFGNCALATEKTTWGRMKSNYR